ncbi:Uncharacterised protein [Streptococcus dysgalactiae subsp. equisimilis]|nr:hypothetical protein BBG03_02570 [Streptococcus dysgalactiae subsp. equisimilis]OBZ02529.1 hypothetical protein BBG04_02090 [Streptococcus dysgalactiae subsp. equisimilis]OCX03136.1 hypothetical protein BBG07_05970 [Streptococcus dysgalactiae subsp. equisimilis]SQE85370.1 Uncharacterised protein [Streptococcus dysgalactiae subsp. equisimilis]
MIYTIFIIMHASIMFLMIVDVIHKKNVDKSIPYLVFLIFNQLSLSEKSVNMLSIVALVASLFVFIDKRK